MTQQGVPTVGDTITIVQRIAAAPGAVVDARPPADSSIATLIGPPVVTREGDSVRISYTVAVWAAGRNQVIFPGAIVVDQRGHVDTLADTRVDVAVASVLPAGRSSAAVLPRSAQPWLARADRSPLPFAVLIPLALIVIGVLHWRWRRRGDATSVVSVATAPERLTPERLESWISGGEARLALDHVEFEVRNDADFADWRERAAAIRFTPGDDAVVAAMVREAMGRIGSAQQPTGQSPQ